MLLQTTCTTIEESWLTSKISPNFLIQWNAACGWLWTQPHLDLNMTLIFLIPNRRRWLVRVSVKVACLTSFLSYLNLWPAGALLTKYGLRYGCQTLKKSRCTHHSIATCTTALFCSVCVVRVFACACMNTAQRSRSSRLRWMSFSSCEVCCFGEESTDDAKRIIDPPATLMRRRARPILQKRRRKTTDYVTLLLLSLFFTLHADLRCPVLRWTLPALRWQYRALAQSCGALYCPALIVDGPGPVFAVLSACPALTIVGRGAVLCTACADSSGLASLAVNSACPALTTASPGPVLRCTLLALRWRSGPWPSLGALYGSANYRHFALICYATLRYIVLNCVILRSQICAILLNLTILVLHYANLRCTINANLRSLRKIAQNR